eukprot:scaffold5812_cov159-Skeletonema_dohrnii-CCMP3373.AAC.1
MLLPSVMLLLFVCYCYLACCSACCSRFRGCSQGLRLPAACSRFRGCSQGLRLPAAGLLLCWAICYGYSAMLGYLLCWANAVLG